MGGLCGEVFQTGTPIGMEPVSANRRLEVAVEGARYYTLNRQMCRSASLPLNGVDARAKEERCGRVVALK